MNTYSSLHTINTNKYNSYFYIIHSERVTNSFLGEEGVRRRRQINLLLFVYKCTIPLNIAKRSLGI